MESNSELKYIFANINEWLKFAEAKHAGLIVLNAAIIVGLLSSYSTICILLFKPVLALAMFGFGVSIFVSLLSQFPVTQNVFYKIKVIANPNFYFFGHLCHLDKHSFKAHLLMYDNNFTINKFDEQLINQILVNARITQAKFGFIKIASYISVFGIGIVGFSSIIKLIWHY